MRAHLGNHWGLVMLLLFSYSLRRSTCSLLSPTVLLLTLNVSKVWWRNAESVLSASLPRSFLVRGFIKRRRRHRASPRLGAVDAVKDPVEELCDSFQHTSVFEPCMVIKDSGSIESQRRGENSVHCSDCVCNTGGRGEEGRGSCGFSKWNPFSTAERWKLKTLSSRSLWADVASLCWLDRAPRGEGQLSFFLLNITDLKMCVCLLLSSSCNCPSLQCSL